MTALPHAARAVVGSVLVLAFDAVLLAIGLGGFAAVARDPRAIALLVVWGLGGLALALRRPVRGQDVARANHDLSLMVVLFVVPEFTPMLAALAARHAWAMLPHASAVSWGGIALVAAGLVLRIGAMLRLGPRFSPLVAVQREHALETSGPYAWVRHPGYLGSLVTCLGGALAFGSAAMLPLVAIMLAAQLARVRGEEKLLASHFGAAWSEYAAQTGALLPRVGRRRPRA